MGQVRRRIQPHHDGPARAPLEHQEKLGQITGDIPLASRCLKNGARVIGSTGKPFTDATIGQALAGRELSQHLRESGLITGGPAPLGKQDRSRFLQQLDQDIQAIRRAAGIR